MAENYYARIVWPQTEEDDGGAIELAVSDSQWHRIEGGEEFDLFAEQANLLSQPPFYRYSLAHGAFGRRLATELAQRLGGRVELAPIPRLPEGAIA
jgi:hypothetical protein